MLNRRQFIKTSALLGAGAGFVPYFASNPVQAWADPNNRLRMACITIMILFLLRYPQEMKDLQECIWAVWQLEPVLQQ